jgi:hypothetical protein
LREEAAAIVKGMAMRIAIATIERGLKVTNLSLIEVGLLREITRAILRALVRNHQLLPQE